MISAFASAHWSAVVPPIPAFSTFTSEQNDSRVLPMNEAILSPRSKIFVVGTGGVGVGTGGVGEVGAVGPDSGFRVPVHAILGSCEVFSTSSSVIVEVSKGSG